MNTTNGVDSEICSPGSCLLITDPHAFLQKIAYATAQRLPGWISDARGVKYIDPLNATIRDVEVCFSKHFRYAYQKEYRIAWLPPEDREKLEPIELEIGSLEDCAELISLEERQEASDEG